MKVFELPVTSTYFIFFTIWQKLPRCGLNVPLIRTLSETQTSRTDHVAACVCLGEQAVQMCGQMSNIRCSVKAGDCDSDNSRAAEVLQRRVTGHIWQNKQTYWGRGGGRRRKERTHTYTHAHHVTSSASSSRSISLPLSHSRGQEGGSWRQTAHHLSRWIVFVE